MNYTSQDINQLTQRGITPEVVDRQIEDLSKGYPFLRIAEAATIGHGVLSMKPMDMTNSISLWKSFCAENNNKTKAKVVKFVPASGAASRMFKELYEFLNSAEKYPKSKEVNMFLYSLDDFAFFDELNTRCIEDKGKTVSELYNSGEARTILEVLLDKQYMGYGNLPKGLLSFHKYDDKVRAACEEHIVEGALYCADADGRVYLHFTVSQEHFHLFKNHIDNVLPYYERIYNMRFDVSYSVQKPATDTVALDEKGSLCRNADGSILFRPGGHGALIQNLNDIDADVVFIKNIDNVVPDRLKSVTVNYKQMLGGILIYNQKVIFDYLALLDNPSSVTEEKINEMLGFCSSTLNINPGTNSDYAKGRYAEYLRSIFDRPIRVCGMVKNEGEPGGGPYLVYNQDGIISPQILESSQIDKNNAEAYDCMVHAEYFNPVDLVCGLKNYRGEKFDLTEYVDYNTGFISQKTKDGKPMKVLELPGLWNGAMSKWNTIFVEVPLATFNPVKTVNDLLREQHR